MKAPAAVATGASDGSLAVVPTADSITEAVAQHAGQSGSSRASSPTTYLVRRVALRTNGGQRGSLRRTRAALRWCPLTDWQATDHLSAPRA